MGVILKVHSLRSWKTTSFIRVQTSTVRCTCTCFRLIHEMLACKEGWWWGGDACTDDRDKVRDQAKFHPQERSSENIYMYIFSGQRRHRKYRGLELNRDQTEASTKQGKKNWEVNFEEGKITGTDCTKEESNKRSGKQNNWFKLILWWTQTASIDQWGKFTLDMQSTYTHHGC